MKTLSRITLVLLLCAGSVAACSVPVFRYALERWLPDLYVAHLDGADTLTSEQQAVAGLLECFEEESDYRANIVLAEKQAGDSNAVPRAGGPYLKVDFPAQFELPLWEGALTEDNVRRLLDSPVRREIAKRVLEGQTAVWVLVESGDKEKDNAAVTLLETTLKELTEQMQLPEISEADRQSVLDMSEGPELQISFSLMRVKRDDPNEVVFLNNLLNIDESLKTMKDPVAYALFARGRALPPLYDDALTADIIAEVCYYIVGECSCEIKAQNIGFDVLMNGAWDAVLMGQLYSEEELPPLTGVAPVIETGVTEVATGTLAVVAAPAEEAAELESGLLRRRVWILLAAGVIVVLGGSVLLMRSR